MSSEDNPRKEPDWVRYLRINRDADVWTGGFDSVNRMLRYTQLRRTNSLGSKALLCYNLYRFCTAVGKNPDELVQLPKSDVESLVRHYSELVKERTGWAPTANNVIAALRTFFRENGFRAEEGTGVVVERFHVPPRASKREEYIPTPREANRIAEAWGRGTRNNALLMMLWSTGLRVSTLLALTYGDIREELAAGKDNLLLRVYPGMKKRVPGACKNNIPYYTFTCKATTEAIKAYIAERVSKVGELLDDAPLFPTENRRIREPGKRNMTPMSSPEVRFIVRSSARRVGVAKWRFVKTHSLRKTFNEFMLGQAPESRPNEMDRIFLMGHIPGGSEDFYTPKRMEDTRSMFAKLKLERDPSLQIAYEMARGHDIDPAVMRDELLGSLGRIPTSEEEVTELRKRIAEKLKRMSRPRTKRSKVIPRSDLETHLANGWTFVSVFGEDKCIVEREEEPAEQPGGERGSA